LKDGEKYEGVDGREKFNTVLELKKEDIIDLIDQLKSLKQYYE
jgi:glycosylphosphatidylinositol transamidase (GPIT) subunit GPI8